MPDRNTVSRPWPTLADVARQNHAVLAACGGLQLLQDDEALAILEPLRTELTKLSLMIEMVAMRADGGDAMRCLILFLAAAIVTVAAARELGRALDVLDLAASGMFDEPLWPGGVA